MYKWLLPTISEVLGHSQADRCPDHRTQKQQSEGTGKSANGTSDRATVWRKQMRSEREWCGAIAAVNCLLEQEIVNAPLSPTANNGSQDFGKSHGLVLSGPVPVLTDPTQVENFSTWTFTSQPQKPGRLLTSHLLPTPTGGSAPIPEPAVLPLASVDPLATEQFCLVLTGGFSLIMVKGQDIKGNPAFQFSFEPEVVHLAWQALRSRVLPFDRDRVLRKLDAEFKKFEPVAPDYKTVCTFTQLLLEHLPEPMERDGGSVAQERNPSELISLDWVGGNHSDWSDLGVPTWVSVTATTVSCALSRPIHLDEGVAPPRDAESLRSPQQSAIELDTLDVSMPSTARTAKPKRARLNERIEELSGATANKGVRNQSPAQDVELLQAIAHEVRTPLATIRTLTRLLLRRRNLDPEVIKRLEAIDRECTEQIDRFGLIFRAVELETSKDTRTPVQLTSTSVTQVLDSCIPRWQKQASRRNLTLDVHLPQKMPSVVSDPTLLDQVLTGVIDNFTSTLPAGGNVQVEVMLAGHQLKVQLISKHPSVDSKESSVSSKHALKSIGQMLMFQPETGNLSLNLSVTKNLFQALGGKLIVRNRPQQGEVLTIFLPLEMRGEPR